MKKTIALKTVALVLLLLLPLASLPLLSFATEPMFSETFVGALDEKYERLYAIDEPKVVLIGGSSVAFGFDSALIEETLGMPVVNFGLYADLGTRLMLELARGAVREGDIVIVAPETDPQTMSLYFNPDITLRAVEGRPSMLLHTSPDSFFACLGAMFGFASDKLSYIQSGTRSRGSGIYDARYFNEYGDMDGTLDLDGDGEGDFPREVNILPRYFDENKRIALDGTLADAEFLDYLADFRDLCHRRGASFYYAYAPMNALAMTYAPDSEETAAFSAALTEALGRDCVLGKPADYVYEAGYFYDSNYHLNEAGAVMHTVQLLDDLLFAREDYTTPLPVPPTAPELPVHNVTYEGADDENCVYFTFEFATEYDAALGLERELGYRITGLTDLGKAQTTLTVPVNYGGYRVTLLGASALAGGSCRTLVLPDKLNALAEGDGIVFTFERGSFEGASALRRLDMYVDNPKCVQPPNLAGVRTPLPVHVKADSYFLYDSDYYWVQIKGDMTLVGDLD